MIDFYLLDATSLDQLLEVEKAFNDTLRSYWYEYNYLTPKWWLLVSLSIFPPIIWCVFVNKKRILEITAFGLFYGVAATILDSIGSNAMVWTYPVQLSPYLYPQIYPYDVGIVIIPFMFVYQIWSNNFKKYLLYAAFLSAFLAFLAEPAMVWLNIYKELTWKHVYSFPIYWILGVGCWQIIKYFKKIEQK